jgi:RluA family pseudouridine synthase
MAHHALRPGDTVLLPADAPAQGAAAPEEPRVLYRDASYLVADKPAGILANGPRSLEEDWRLRLNLPGLRAAHRLDRDTSGCLLLAMDEEAFAQAVRLFAARAVIKTYRAIVAGRLNGGTAVIRRPLDGQEAVTRAREISGSTVASHVEIRIETGRTHQIRKHLAGLGHPVLGDPLYAGDRRYDARALALPRQMLHASNLEFPHLADGRRIRVHAPLPLEFRQALRAFGLR